jgi:hypothetical protein
MKRCTNREDEAYCQHAAVSLVSAAVAAEQQQQAAIRALSCRSRGARA